VAGIDDPPARLPGDRLEGWWRERREDRIARDHRELALRDACPTVDPTQAAPADDDRDR